MAPPPEPFSGPKPGAAPAPAAPPFSAPASGPRPLPTGVSDLDARILRAELDLMAREERVHALLDELGARWERARQPSRWAAPAAGAGALLALLWWWRRATRRRAFADRARPPDAAPRRSTPPPHGRWPLLHWLSLVWPLLPGHWRARWGSGADTLFHVGEALARRWLQGTPRGDAGGGPVRPVARVDLARYAGTWHEIARLPLAHERVCAGQPQACYDVLGNGRMRVRNRCRRADGSWQEAVGEARPVPGSGGARLRVSFVPPALRWLPGVWGDYWVLYLDEGYTVALVGEPRRRHLWLLAREPRIARATLELLLVQARRQGFDIERLEASV